MTSVPANPSSSAPGSMTIVEPAPTITSALVNPPVGGNGTATVVPSGSKTAGGPEATVSTGAAAGNSKAAGALAVLGGALALLF